MRAIQGAKYEQQRCGGVFKQDVWIESHYSWKEYSELGGCGGVVDSGRGGSAEGA